MSALRRPVLRYHGGKWRLAPWVLGHFREHRAGGAKKRTEVLWLNPACARALGLPVPTAAARAIAPHGGRFGFEGAPW